MFAFLVLVWVWVLPLAQGTYRPSRPENLVARFRMIPAANSQGGPHHIHPQEWEE